LSFDLKKQYHLKEYLKRFENFQWTVGTIIIIPVAVAAIQSTCKNFAKDKGSTLYIKSKLRLL
jgi:hypothetical protein